MFRAGIIAALATLLLAFAPIPAPKPLAHSQPQPIQQSSNAQQPSAPFQRGTDAAPIIVKIAHTKEGDQQTAEDASYKAEESKNNTLLMIFNGILAAVAMLELIYIVRQESWMKKSVKAAQDAASAAVAAQRAWIKLEVFLAAPFIAYDHGIRLQLKARLTNIGHSPATELNPWAALACGGKGLNFFEAAKKFPPRQDGVGFSLFPEDTVDIDLFGTLVTEEIDRALNDASAAQHIYVGAAVLVTYQFAGGIGATTKLYRVAGPALLESFDIRKFPVAMDAMRLDPVPMQDTAS